MKFFTDKSVINDYLLIKIKDYIKLKEKGESFEKWKEVFIDPGVYQLKKADEYDFILKLIENKLNPTEYISEFIEGFPKNHYFSLDYPCDMNIKFTDKFLDKSWTNAIKYCQYPQYITTVQFKFYDYWNFKKWFDKYNSLYSKEGSQILGLGNLCRLFFLDEYMKMILEYTFFHCNYPRVHIYGLALKNIPYAEKLANRKNIKLSVDSTKWTRCLQSIADKVTGGVRRSCKSSERQAFFDEYMKVLKNRGINLE